MKQRHGKLGVDYKDRDGGGVLLTQGIHTLDLFLSLAGMPSEVTAFATTSSVHKMETEDIVGAALRFANCLTSAPMEQTSRIA
jgi:predicted dehydrogenase